MELIYLYIRKYETIFEDEEFNFSSNYTAHIEDRQLFVSENKEAIKGYYGKNVNNVVMFLGQNGMGKSTLLDILGMKRGDRSRDTYEDHDGQQRIKSSYFLLYHLYDHYYGFEFVDFSFVKGNEKIKNIDMQGESEDSALYKLPMGTIFRLEDGIFQYCDNIMLKWLRDQGVENKIEYAYFTSDRYNKRIDNRYQEYDYLFERNYYLNEKSYQYLYEYFVRSHEVNNELLKERNISIINSMKIEEGFIDREQEVVSYLYDRKYELDEQFGLKDKIRIQMEEIAGVEQKVDERCTKDQFLHTFHAQLIEYYFLEQWVGWREMEGQTIDIHAPIPDMAGFEQELNSCSEEEKENFANHRVLNFQNEYIRLLYIIKRNTSKSGTIDLKAVLEYTLSRVEMAAKGIVEIAEKEAVFQFLTLLEALPKHYFKSKEKIEVRCDTGMVDKKVVELFKWYDYCLKVRGEEGRANCISKIVTIQMAELSEGHSVFLGLISRTVSALYNINPGDSLILLMDEPDRSLHPELSRKFLDSLVDCIHSCQDRNVQIVLTSHSPFIVTDVLPESVYAIDSEGGHRRIRKDMDTFATNIYYLLMDSFMLQNTFGEYSYKQLKQIMELFNSNSRLDTERLETMKKIIDRIGEKAVKNKMMQLYQKQEENRSELVAKILKETDETKIKKIKEILEKND